MHELWHSVGMRVHTITPALMITRVQNMDIMKLFTVYTMSLENTLFCTGAGFDPMNQSNKGPAPALESKAEDTYVQNVGQITC